MRRWRREGEDRGPQPARAPLRFLYLTWGNVPLDGTFVMFRRAKLMLGAVDPDLVRSVERSGSALVGTVDLTDATGGPRCARVDGPALVWRAA